MSKVHVVTDSNAYLSPEVREKYRIQVIPHRIKVGSAYFEEGADFSCDDMFAKTQEMQAAGNSRLPEVQAADLNTILDCYQNLGEDAEEIISIHMSSHLSPMWKHARRAAELLKGRYTIRVIDSLSTSFGLGLLVQKAAEAAERGTNVHEIARIVNGAVPHLYLTSFSESLNYLERSTHLSPSQSVLGTMLGIKAMLIMEDGKLLPLEKVQTREEVIEKLAEFVVEFANVEEVGVMQHGYEQAQDELIERLRENGRLASVPIHDLTYPPSLAVYMGPEVIGVMVYEGDC
jgi:DegV family protein with EDD domain